MSPPCFAVVFMLIWMLCMCLHMPDVSKRLPSLGGSSARSCASSRQVCHFPVICGLSDDFWHVSGIFESFAMLSACPHVSNASLLLPSLTGSSMCDPVPLAGTLAILTPSQVFGNAVHTYACLLHIFKMLESAQLPCAQLAATRQVWPHWVCWACTYWKVGCCSGPRGQKL